MSPNRRISLNIGATYGRSLYALISLDGKVELWSS